MPRPVRLSLALLFALAVAGCDRHPAKKPDPTKGVVTGQVLCADTGKPARFATVTLSRVAATADKDEEQNKDSAPLQATETAITDLEGRFRMEAVEPGRYYAFATLDGYLDLVHSLDFDRIAALTSDADQAKEAVAEWKDHLVEINVRAQRTSETPLSLERGAELAGTVSFDDGSPAIGLHFRLLRKTKDGKASEVGLALFREWKLAAVTDSHGRYALTNLPAGEYTVCALLPAATESEAAPVCLGNLFRRHGAKSVKVSAGEVATVVDIEVPLGKLHTVSGTLAARDGHPIPHATLRLTWADDKEPAREMKVDSEDGSFRLDYVPEGSFLLEVADAAETQDNNHPQKPAVQYTGKQIPLRVEGEVPDLNVVLDKKRAAETVPKP